MWGTIIFSLKVEAHSISPHLLSHLQCGVTDPAVPAGVLGGP